LLSPLLLLRFGHIPKEIKLFQIPLCQIFTVNAEEFPLKSDYSLPKVILQVGPLQWGRIIIRGEIP